MPDPSLIPPKPTVPILAEGPVLSGPHKTERFGNALGIDLCTPDTLLVVSRESRLPRASLVITTAARLIIRLSKAGEKLDALLVWGSEGDVTLHPDFKEITGNLRDLRNKWFPKATLAALCGLPRVENPEVRRTLAIYDRVVVRMEWGTAKTFATLTGRKSTDFANYCAHLGHLENLIVQARFGKGEADNASDAEVKAWIKKLSELKPREVHILPTDAKSGKKVKVPPKSRLSEIAAEVTAKTGIPAVISEITVPVHSLTR